MHEFREMFLGYFVTVAGLICFLEGLPYMACPGQLKKVMQQITSLPSHLLRALGCALMLLGLLFVYWGRQHGG